jgi:hypothetical protein
MKLSILHKLALSALALVVLISFSDKATAHPEGDASLYIKNDTPASVTCTVHGFDSQPTVFAPFQDMTTRVPAGEKAVTIEWYAGERKGKLTISVEAGQQLRYIFRYNDNGETELYVIKQ